MQKQTVEIPKDSWVSLNRPGDRHYHGRMGKVVEYDGKNRYRVLWLKTVTGSPIKIKSWVADRFLSRLPEPLHNYEL